LFDLLLTGQFSPQFLEFLQALDLEVTGIDYALVMPVDNVDVREEILDDRLQS
jgi:hypothetical protein